MNKEIKAFWNRFIEAKKLPKETTYLEAFYFDVSEESAKHLCNLVLEGKKKATASSLYHYEVTNEEIPKVGVYSIVTDFQGNPYPVIQTKAITIIPFKDLTFDIVKQEGEDDNLKSWQDKHIRFYQIDGQESGYTFDQEMPVVFEDFLVVYKEKELCDS